MWPESESVYGVAQRHTTNRVKWLPMQINKQSRLDHIYSSGTWTTADTHLFAGIDSVVICATNTAASTGHPARAVKSFHCMTSSIGIFLLTLLWLASDFCYYKTLWLFFVVFYCEPKHSGLTPKIPIPNHSEGEELFFARWFNTAIKPLSDDKTHAA